jgi:hypothetical protein
MAATAEQGILARFDDEGAHLSLQDDVISVSATGFGREVREVLLPSSPVLGACLDDMVEPGGDCVRRLEYVGSGSTEWRAGPRAWSRVGP